MQNNVVMAFRKRMKRYGYRDISIRMARSQSGIPLGQYTVSAVEPLGGVVVQTCYTVSMMHHAFKFKDTDQRVNVRAPDFQDTDQQVFHGLVLVRR